MSIRLDDIINDSKTIGIAGHVRPDGDCVGSCLGVYNYIRTYFPDRDTHVFLEPIPEIFSYLSGSDEIEEPREDDERKFDLFITLDCGDTGRLGKAGHFIDGALHTLCVDHHVSNTDFAEENYVFTEASSTCELIGELIDHDKITKEIAECLYTGMVTDTGVFQYECTHSSTMNFAGVLMDKGIDYPHIVDNVFFAKSLVKGKIHGIAWNHAKLFANGKIIGSYVTCDDMDAVGASPKHMDGITSDLRSTRGVELAIFIYPLPDGTFKGSARSARTFDCAAFAAKHGGGGHVRAAGFSVEGGSPEEWVEKICNEAAELL